MRKSNSFTSSSDSDYNYNHNYSPPKEFNNVEYELTHKWRLEDIQTAKLRRKQMDKLQEDEAIIMKNRSLEEKMLFDGSSFTNHNTYMRYLVLMVDVVTNNHNDILTTELKYNISATDYINYITINDVPLKLIISSGKLLMDNQNDLLDFFGSIEYIRGHELGYQGSICDIINSKYCTEDDYYNYFPLPSIIDEVIDDDIVSALEWIHWILYINPTRLNVYILKILVYKYRSIEVTNELIEYQDNDYVDIDAKYIENKNFYFNELIFFFY